MEIISDKPFEMPVDKVLYKNSYYYCYKILLFTCFSAWQKIIVRPVVDNYTHHLYEAFARDPALLRQDCILHSVCTKRIFTVKFTSGVCEP